MVLDAPRTLPGNETTAQRPDGSGAWSRPMKMSEVKTPTGTVVGTTEIIDGTPIQVFRGVQYATASRFAAPGPVPPRTGPRDAISFSPAAPQPIGGPLDGL